jgi:hypothetical protein
LDYGEQKSGKTFGLAGLGKYGGQQLPPNLEYDDFGLAAAVRQFRMDQPLPDGQVPETLDNIEKPDILGALKRTLGAAETIPQRGRGQELLPHAIEYLPEDTAWTKIRFDGAHRAGGSTDAAGKAAMQVLTAGLGCHLVFEIKIQILYSKFNHNERIQLSAVSDQLDIGNARQSADSNTNIR